MCGKIILSMAAAALTAAYGETLNWVGGASWQDAAAWDAARVPAAGDAVKIDSAAAGGEDSAVIALGGDAAADSVFLASGRLVAENARLELASPGGGGGIL